MEEYPKIILIKDPQHGVEDKRTKHEQLLELIKLYPSLKERADDFRKTNRTV